MESNFVTPPDLMEKTIGQHTVVMIDPPWENVEEIALFCKESKKTYDVYLYSSDMDDLEWLDKAVGLADRVIINTVQSELSPIKDMYSEKSNKALYYGPKSFFNAVLNRIERPLDYFKYFDNL